MTPRLATPADAEALATAGRASFVDAFGDLYRPADLAAFLNEERSPRKMAALIADPATRVAVIENGETIAGYCITTYGKGFAERPDPQPAHPAYLAQLYCRGTATGRGLGAALIADSLAQAQLRGCDAVQLSVYSGNIGAQRFYARYGFAKVADIHFRVGEQIDDEYLYEKPLTGDAP